MSNTKDELKRLSDNACDIWAGESKKQPLLPITDADLAAICHGMRNPKPLPPLSAGLMAAAGRFQDRAGSAYSRAISRLADGES